MSSDGACKTFFTDLKQYPLPSTHEDGSTYYEVAQVLDATRAFLPFFDAFGTLFKICKSDLEGNINKIQAKLDKYEGVGSFKSLLQYEIENGLSKKSDSAAIATLWYKRGLEFLSAFLQEMLATDSENTKEPFDAAYTATLKKYHGWIVQKTILVVANMIPSRNDIILKLSHGTVGLGEEMYRGMRIYLEDMRPVVTHLNKLIMDLQLESNATV